MVVDVKRSDALVVGNEEEGVEVDTVLLAIVVVANVSVT